MTSMQMYELAREAILEAAGEDPAGSVPDILWVGGILEDRRAVGWYMGTLFMVHHDTGTGDTAVEAYYRANK